jgi:hypothetical protein
MLKTLTEDFLAILRAQKNPHAERKENHMWIFKDNVQAWHPRVIRNATVTMSRCRSTSSQKWLGGHKALMVYA